MGNRGILVGRTCRQKNTASHSGQRSIYLVQVGVLSIWYLSPEYRNSLTHLPPFCPQQPSLAARRRTCHGRSRTKSPGHPRCEKSVSSRLMGSGQVGRLSACINPKRLERNETHAWFGIEVFVEVIHMGRGWVWLPVDRKGSHPNRSRRPTLFSSPPALGKRYVYRA